MSHSKQPSQLLVDLNKIHNNITKTGKSLNISEMTIVVSSLDILYSFNNNGIETQVLELIRIATQSVLKCLQIDKDEKECDGSVQDHLDLFWEIIKIVMSGGEDEKRSWSDGNVTRIVKFGISILITCIKGLKVKKIVQVLSQINEVKTNSYINRVRKVSMNNYVPILILQSLYEIGYKKFDQIAEEYLQKVLSWISQKSMTEIQQYLGSIFTLYGTQQCYMSYKITKMVMEQYIKEFEAVYHREGKYQMSKFDPKIIGFLIGLVCQLGKGIRFTKIQQAQIRLMQCNFCVNKSLQYEQYVLEVDKISYNVYLCRQCKIHLFPPKTKIGSNHKMALLLLQLACNNEERDTFSQNKQMRYKNMYRLVTEQEHQISYCQHNKQLKLVKDRIIRYAMFSNNLYDLSNKLWSMLMIFTNHNDVGIRLKAIKVIGDILEPNQSHNQHNTDIPINKLQKCLKNRLNDTQQKIRISSINSLISLIPIIAPYQKKDNKSQFILQSICETIKTQFLQSSTDSTKSMTSKNIMDLLNKLCSLVKVNSIKEKFTNQANIPEFVNFVTVLVELSIFYRKNKQNQKKKNAKKSKKKSKNEAQQEDNEQKTEDVEKVYQILHKHKQGLRKIVKQYRKSEISYKKLIKQIIQHIPGNRSKKQIQTCYNERLQLFVDISSIEIKLKNSNESNMVVEEVIADLCSDNSQTQYFLDLCLKNQIIVGWILQQNQGNFIKAIITTVNEYCTNCQLQDNSSITLTNNDMPAASKAKISYEQCVKKCRNLLTILETYNKKHLPIKFSHFKQNELIIELSTLQQNIITQLMPQTNILDYQVNGFNKNYTDCNSQSNSDMDVLCRLVGAIDILLKGNNGYIMSVYTNCWKFVAQTVEYIKQDMEKVKKEQHGQKVMTEEQREQKIRVMGQTIKIMLGLLPQIYRSNELLNIKNKQFYINGIFQSIMFVLVLHFETANTVKQYLYDLFVSLLGNVWQICPALVCECQKITLNILEQELAEEKSDRKYVSINTILFHINSIISQTQSVSLLQKIKDICMYLLNKIEKMQYLCLLENKWMYFILRLLVNKGFLNYYQVSRIFISAIVAVQDHHQQCVVKDICIEMIKQASMDITQSRQLYTNFSQTLKFIGSVHRNHQQDIYLEVDRINQQKCTTILSKQQQSQQSLKPTLLKCLCDHLNKLAINGKLINSEGSVGQWELFLVFNTFDRCQYVHINDYKAVIRSMMAIVDSFYIQAVSFIRSNSQFYINCQPFLRVLASLNHFLNGVPYKQSNNQAQKYYKIKDNIIELTAYKKKVVNINKQNVLKYMEYLYERILYGSSDRGQDSADWSQFDDDTQTYDTSENAQQSNLKKARKNKKTKVKMIQSEQFIPNQNRKRTKKPVNREKKASRNKYENKSSRNKTAPKTTHLQFNQEIVEIEQQNSQVIDYRKKLRNRSKVI